MCIVNIDYESFKKYQIQVMYLKVGRIFVLLLNILLIGLLVIIWRQFYGVYIYRDGGFSPWSEFTPCSKSCGRGVHYRSRSCTMPEPSIGGRNCSWLGRSTEIQECNTSPCSGDGGFETWARWSNCNSSCGAGWQTRIRHCINPAPKYRGKDCSELGAYEEVRICSSTPCPVDGQYSEWSTWSDCSVKCGSGRQIRRRSCDSPAPSNGGSNCDHLGPASEDKECIVVCDIDGDYGEWSEWNFCSTTCGEGRRQRTRKCDSPPRSGAGRECFERGLGNPIDDKPCIIRSCNENGGYSEWSTWTTCSQPCGGGTQERRRQCNNPEPSGTGMTCRQQGLGGSREVLECNEHQC